MKNSRQKIVDSARRLFFRYGLGRVSVKEICSNGGVSKMTFYRYFSNKEEVALSIIKNIYDEARVRFNEELKRDAPIEEKLKKVMEMKIELISGFSDEFLRDISISDIPQIAEFIGKEKIKSVETIKEVLQTAREKGEIRKDIPPDTIITVLESLDKIFFKLQRNGNYDTGGQIMNDMFNIIYYGIFSR